MDGGVEGPDARLDCGSVRIGELHAGQEADKPSMSIACPDDRPQRLPLESVKKSFRDS